MGEVIKLSAKMKHALLHLTVWVTVTILFLSIFFTSDTIAEWGDNRTKTLMLAIILGIGFSGGAILNYIYRERDDVIIQDERDTAIQNKAIKAGFVTVVLASFVYLITLYIAFENVGVVPVAWIWLAAYGLAILANISVAAFSVYFYRKSGR